MKKINSNNRRNFEMKKVTVLLFLAGLFLNNLTAHAQDVFTSAATANWNVGATWTIVRDGDNPGTSAYPGQTAGSVDGADVVIIDGGFTVTLDFNFTLLNPLGSLTVGGGTAGTLAFPCNVTVGGGRTITFSGNVTVNSNGTIQTSEPGTPTARTHTMIVQGDLSNAGTIDLEEVTTVNRFVNLQFTGASNTTVTGSGTWDTRAITYNKSSQSVRIINQSANFTTSVGGSLSTFTLGTYEQDVDALYTATTAGAQTVNSRLHIKQGKFSVVGGTLTANDSVIVSSDTLYAQNLTIGATNGRLVITTGGRVEVGDGTAGGALTMNALSHFFIDGSTSVFRTLTNSGGPGSSWVIGADCRITINDGTVSIAGNEASVTARIGLEINGPRDTLTMNAGTFEVFPLVTADNSRCIRIDAADVYFHFLGGNIDFGNPSSGEGRIRWNNAVGDHTLFQVSGASTVFNIADNFDNNNNSDADFIIENGATIRTGYGGGAGSSANEISGSWTVDNATVVLTPTGLNMTIGTAAVVDDTMRISNGSSVTIGSTTAGNLTFNAIGYISGATSDILIGGSLTLGQGSQFYMSDGTFRVGLLANSAGNVTWPADANAPTIFKMTGGTFTLGDGNATFNMGDNDNIPALGTTTAFDSLHITGGTLNVNGRMTFSDANARFHMTGGEIKLNPSDTSAILATQTLLFFQRGIVNITGGTITFKNPKGLTGTGVTINLSALGDPSAAARLSGSTTANTPLNFNGSTIQFGDGIENRSGSTDGFDMTLNNSHSYGTFKVNNPSGTNRHVTINGAGVTYTFNDGFDVTAGELRLGTNIIVGDGSGTFNIGSTGYMKISNTNGANQFPGTFSSYTVDAASTVEYDGATGTAFVNCPAVAGWGNLTISGSGTTKSLQGSNNTVRGTLQLNSGILSATTLLTMATGSKIVRAGTDASGILTVSGGSTVGSNDYTIEYTDTAKTTQSAELSGTGTKSLRVSLDYGEILTLHSDTTLGDSLIISEGSILNTNAHNLYVGKDAGFFGSKSGLGHIIMRGSGANIYGLSRGIINALEISSPDSIIQLSDSLRVDTLALTAGKLNVGDFALAIGSSTSGSNGIVSVSSPGTSKMIQVSGSLSAGGVARYYSGASNFTWPIGVAGKYTPATINVSSTGLPGTIIIRAVDDTAGTKTNSPTYAPALVYYWNVSSEGFSNPQTIHTYTWNNADTLEATYSGTYAFRNFVPGRYSSSETAWFTEDQTNVSLAGHTITFDGNGTFLGTIDGDYTMGQTSISGASDAFGSVTVFYSRHTEDHWDHATAWSNVGYHDSTAAASAPGPNSPVKIMAGDSITITSSNTRCASLVDSGVVYIGSTTGHNFGTVTGNGKLTLTSSTFPGGTFTSFMGSSGGTVEYGSGTYTTAFLNNYNNLIFSGTGTKTTASRTLTASGNVTITGGTVVLLNSSSNGNLFVTGDLLLEGSGDELRMQNGNARIISITGNTTINSGAKFVVNASGTAVANSVTFYGDLVNNGDFDMSVSGGQYANVIFSGTGTQTISGTTADTTDFETLTINKGTGVAADTANILEVNSNRFTISGSAGGTTKALRLIRGTFKLTSQGTSPVLDISTGGGDFPILGGTRLWIAGGSAQLSGAGDNVNLKGQLKLSAGSLNVGTSTTIPSSIFYDSTAAGVEVIGTGILRVSGALRPAAGTRFSYIQSGDSVIVGRYTTVTGGATFQVVSDVSSLFQMSGGVLALRRAFNNQAIIDIGANVIQRISGGTVHLLDPSLVTANNYEIVATGVVDTVRLYNLTIGPCAGFTGNISLDNDHLNVMNNFTLNVAASGTFRTHNGAANRDLILGGNFTRTSGNFTTVTGGTGTSTLVLNGSSGKQTISGTTTFNNLTINNTSSPSDTVILGSGTDITVTGDWTTTAGDFDAITNKRAVTFQSTTVAQNITGSTLFNNLTINNTFGPVTLASGVLTVDSVLTLTNGILAIGANSLVLNETNAAAVEGAFDATRMIQTGGLAADLGVTKAFPAGTHGFRYPVGTGANYTPATIRITNAGTTPAAGTITVNPVNSAHPNLVDGSIALPYYWKVTKSGLAADAAAQHYYVYGTGITPLGTEASYVGGYYIPFTWTNPTSVEDATGDSITIFSPDSTIIAADFTAGEPTSFGQPTVYYSKASGNWNTVGTWGVGSYTGANGTPTATDPVVIGNGRTVTIQNGLAARTVVGVTFDQYGGSTPGPGTLLIQNTATNDLGNVAGVGTIILDNSSATPVLPTGTYTNFVAKDSGTVIFRGSTSYTIPSGQTTTFNDIVFANNTTKTVGTNITVNGTMRILGGQVNLGTFTANHNGGVGDSLALASGVVLRVSGAANFPASYNVYDFNSTSKTLYDFAGATTVSSLNGYSYGRLQFIGATAIRVRTLDGHINVRDSLILGNFNNLYTSTNNYNVTLGGHLVLGQAANSLLTLGNNTFTFDGTSAQEVKRIANANGTANFYNLTINNTNGVSFVYSGTAGTFRQVDTVRNALVVGAANNLTLGRGNTWVFGGAITYPSQTGTITSSDSTDLTMTGSTVNDTLRFSSGAVARSFKNFTINRTASSAQVVITGTNDSLQLTGTLTLTNGIIRMGTNTMRLMNSAIIPVSGGDSTSYVDGKMAITFPASTNNVGRNFEIGNGGFYRPVRVTGSTGASRTRVRAEIIPRGATVSSKPSDVKGISNVRFYRVSVDSGLVFTATTDTVRISIATNSYDVEGVSEPDSIRVMRSVDSLNWTTLVGAGYQTFAPAGRDSGGNAGILFTNSAGGGTYYAYGTLSSDNSTPVLLSGKFRAVPYENKVRLEWRTESELDNAYWIIERKEISSDLSKSQAFQSILTVEGQGSKSSATDYAELDYGVEIGKTYMYRLADVSLDGTVTYHNDVTLTVELPNKFILEPNAPNPFNPETTIKFRLPVASKVSLKVYNILGQEVTTLIDRSLDGGFHQALWNGLNKYNQSVASGIYIYRLTAVSADGKDRFTQTRKMILLK